MGRWRLNHNWNLDSRHSHHSTQESFPCFVAGSTVLTASGLVPVQTLRVGDRVQTMDNGFQKIRWIGLRTVDGRGRMAPVCIPRDAMNNDRDLWVSPQHRMLVSGTPVSLLYAEPQAFVPAKALVGHHKIRQRPRRSVTYVHFMFDNHEVVFANGAATESLLIGPEAANSLPDAALQEIETLFPDLKTKAPLSARLCIPVNQSVSLF